MERLAWIDDYIERIRPYIYVRTHDCILIKRPNKAYRLNKSGITILDRLVNKRNSIEDVCREYGCRDDVIDDIQIFFRDLRCLLTHGLPEDYKSPAVQRASFHYRFTDLPVLSEIAITYRCNLACQFCYAGCNCTKSPTGNAQEMTLDDVRRVLDIIWNDAKVPSVSFTGGEPTLREDLPEMISYAKKIGLRVNLITNGTRCTGPLVRRLADAGLDSVQVSIEASKAKLHNEITRARGSFEGSIRAVKSFQEAGIIVHINTTLNRLNIDDVAHIPKLARLIGLERLSMNMTIPAGSTSIHPSLTLDYEEIGQLVENIQKSALQEGVEFMWYSPTPVCVFNPIARGLGNKGCAACDGLLSVAPDGNVLPCSSYDEPLGNLLEDGFDAVWNNDRSLYFREKKFAPAGCRACSSFSACQSGCPLYWRAKGYDKLEAIMKPDEGGQA